MWKKVGYVKGSKYRTNVMKSLTAGPKIPTELADDIKIYPNHVSNTLTQLKNQDLVECINP